MPVIQNDIPEMLPVLSAGRHRSPRQGACFMEFASYLAGERWSDHPECTHPSLASLARAVNDCTSDEARSRLSAMIPSVIGLTSPDPRLPIVVAVRAGTRALPVASDTRQHTIAVGLLHCRDLALASGGAIGSELVARIDEALLSAPTAERWARRFHDSVATGHKRSDDRAMQALLTFSVVGIAEACVNDADDILYEVLEGAIADCERLIGIAHVEPRVPARIPVPSRG